MSSQSESSPVKRILICEDEVLLAEDLAYSLRNLGHEALKPVISGEEAIRIAEISKPDLILMDINLEGEIDGIEAARQIRARSDIPIVYLTAYRAQDVLQRAKKTEPYGYLSKPVGFLELRSVVETALYKHEADRKVRESEQRLSLALNAAGLGTWDWNVRTSEQVFDRRWAEMLGYSPDEITRGFDSWKALVHPDDLQGSRQAMKAHLEGSTPYYEQEQRLRTKSGEWKWILSRGKIVERDENGKPLRVAGTHLDITERKTAQEELQKREARLMEAESIGKMGNWEWNTQTGKVYWSQGIYEIFEVSPEEFIPSYENHLEFVPTEDREGYEKTVQRCLSSGEPFVYEMRLVATSGRAKILWVRGYVKLDEEEQHIGLRGTVQDITDLKKAEQALRESEAQKQAILDGITTNMAFVNEKLEILWINKTAADSVGKPASEMVGRKCHEYWANPEKPCDNCPTVKAFESRQSQHVEIVTPDGRVWDEKGEPVFDENGNILGVIEIAQDITARKQAEEALRQSEERYRRMVETASEGIWVVDNELRMTLVNPRAAEMLGYSAEEMLGRTIDSFLFPEDLEAHDERMEIRRSGGDQVYELRIRRKDGKSLWAIVSATALKDKEGNFSGALAMFIDITKLKRLERNLRGAEERFRLVMEATNDGIWDWDMTSDRVYRSPRFMAMMGEEATDLMGRAGDWHHRIHPEDWPMVRGELDASRTGQQPFRQMEFRIIKKSGEMVWILSRGKVVARDETGKPTRMVGAHTDITEQKEIERKLREHQNQLQAIVAASPAAIFFVNSKGDIIFANPKMGELFGRRHEELIGSPYLELAHPEERSIGYARMQSLMRGETDHAIVERRYLTADGREFLGQLSGRRLLRPDGTLRGLVGIITDITDQRKYEDRIRASLKEKEVLLREINHRVKNNLAIISSLLNLQSNHCADDSSRKMFRDAQSRVRSMSLAHELLYQSENMAHIRISEYVGQLTSYLVESYAGLGRRIEIDKRLDNAPLSLKSAIPIGFLITELVSNSLKHAFPDRREGRIEISIRQMGENELELVVADNGVGIPEGIDFHNSGSLGLKLAETFAEQLRGKIDFRRQGGTRVSVRFPANDEDQ